MRPPLKVALRSQAVLPFVGLEASEKWRIGGAFGFAILLHLAVIGLAAFWSQQPEGMLVSLAPGSVEVLIQADSPLDDLAPLPDIDLPVPAPPPLEEYLFTEATFRALSAPLPEYPAAARQKWNHRRRYCGYDGRSEQRIRDACFDVEKHGKFVSG